MSKISDKIFEIAKKSLPKISKTEEEALTAGTPWWDKYIFSNDINWYDNAYDQIETQFTFLTEEEKAFINGPVQELCEMIDDYDINHDIADLPEEMWEFLKNNKFFGMIIPKEYGGLEFSAKAHSEVIIKIASKSIAVAVTTMVPNSLGPAELLLQYGTDEEKEKYLPRLATGKDLPCFALTNPYAGSDASNIPDTAYIGMGKWENKDVLGLYLHINKRYITLAPVATLVGLAVQTKDPFNMLELHEGEDLGISLVLIPSSTPGLEIGNRHNPLETHFMNGPIRGTNVFVPMSMVIGGKEAIGKGWKMLMECLAVGRAISLPSLGTAACKLAAHKAGAYAAVRRQFGLQIGKFEGIQEILARIAGFTYIANSTRRTTLRAIDYGHKPSVLSAICKYHITEMARQATNDAMDIVGGSGIMLGSKNIFGRIYMSMPIAITVEGANILTRNMIIFGQGVMAAHPHLYYEIKAIKEDDKSSFFKIVNWHCMRFFNNLVSTIVKSPKILYLNLFKSKNTCYTKDHVDHLSGGFALTTDVTLMLLQGSLKKRERVSARLGDILSYLYMLSSIHVDAKNSKIWAKPPKTYKVDVFLWSQNYLLHKIQETFYDLFKNYPNRFIGSVLRFIIFPFGKRYKKPDDNLDAKVAEVLLKPNDFREELTDGIFTSSEPSQQTYKLEKAFRLMGKFIEIDKKLKGKKGNTFEGKADRAVIEGVITENEKIAALRAHDLINDVIQVNEFESV